MSGFFVCSVSRHHNSWYCMVMWWEGGWEGGLLGKNNAAGTKERTGIYNAGLILWLKNSSSQFKEKWNVSVKRALQLERQLDYSVAGAWREPYLKKNQVKIQATLGALTDRFWMTSSLRCMQQRPSGQEHNSFIVRRILHAYTTHMNEVSNDLIWIYWHQQIAFSHKINSSLRINYNSK